MYILLTTDDDDTTTNTTTKCRLSIYTSHRLDGPTAGSWRADDPWIEVRDKAEWFICGSWI